MFSPPDVADDFGDFVDVAADHLGLVVLEAPGPVRGFFDLAGLEEGVDLVDACLVDDVPDPEVCCFVDRGLDDEVAAVDPEGHVLGGCALDVSGGEVRDGDGTVVGIDQRRPHLVASRHRLLGGVVGVTHRGGDPAAARDGVPVLAGPVADLLQFCRVRLRPRGASGALPPAHLPTGRDVRGKNPGQLVDVGQAQVDLVRNSFKSKRDRPTCPVGQSGTVEIVDELDKSLLGH